MEKINDGNTNDDTMYENITGWNEPEEKDEDRERSENSYASNKMVLGGTISLRKRIYRAALNLSGHITDNQIDNICSLKKSWETWEPEEELTSPQITT